MPENEDHHRVDVPHRSSGEDKCADSGLCHSLTLVSLPLDVLILRNENPSELAQLAEYGYVICATRKNFRDVSDRLAEFLERPHDRRADVLVEKECQVGR